MVDEREKSEEIPTEAQQPQHSNGGDGLGVVMSHEIGKNHPAGEGSGAKYVQDLVAGREARKQAWLEREAEKNAAKEGGEDKSPSR